MDVKRIRHAAYAINYRCVWTPKFRRPVLVNGNLARLEELIYQKTEAPEGEVIELVIQPDHVHLFGSFPPTIAPFHIVHRIKGYTAHVMRREFPPLNSRLPNLWTRSYYVGTVGSVSAEAIERYIEEQPRS